MNLPHSIVSTISTLGTYSRSLYFFPLNHPCALIFRCLIRTHKLHLLVYFVLVILKMFFLHNNLVHLLFIREESIAISKLHLIENVSCTYIFQPIILCKLTYFFGQFTDGISVRSRESRLKRSCYCQKMITAHS